MKDALKSQEKAKSPQKGNEWLTQT
jgi:hypothetical protein